MKKLVFILTILAFTFATKAQIVNIPDANFKAYLVGNTAINTNLNSEIEVSEANAFTGLINLKNGIFGLGVSDLSGIENFVNLTGLNCELNNLTSLDVSSNIALTYLNCGGNQISSINISSNVALTELSCQLNNLTSLDVSSNIALTNLNCHENNLTSLDVSLNTALISLACGGNNLTSLDVSFNTALIELYCQINPSLTILNLESNTALKEIWCNKCSLDSLFMKNCTSLEVLYCEENNLKSLDLSTNTSLIEIACDYNALEKLNLSNINVNNLFDFAVTGNPNLSCIQVDDPVFMNANFGSTSFKDAQTTYSSYCFFDTEPNTIYGTIYHDQDSNCAGESSMYKNILVKDTRGYYGVVDTNGYYSLKTDSGTAEIEQILTHPYINQTCFNGGYSVTFDTLGEDTSGFDFYNTVVECPLLNVEVTSNRRRRCFNNHTYVTYFNDGYADETNVEVVVDLTEFVHMVSADRSYTLDADSNYVFSIGNLAQGESGKIHIVDSVACENGIVGLTQCTRAWITPINDCINNLDTTVTEWDKSSVMVTGTCLKDTSVQFVIYNTGDFGDGDMDGTSEYRIYLDNLLSYTSTLQLNGQDSMIIEVPANGQTIRLEADQRFGHPGNSRPRATIEACGNGGVPIEFGMPLEVELDNLDYEVAEHCLPIIDSYDPNDKKALPAGITSNRYVHPESRINYTVRFQNTGSDTAYTVIVTDTLSQDLDLATIKFGASSHDYSFDIRSGNDKQPVLMFTFNDIDLVDSMTNEEGSQGFLSFSIKANDGTVNNTVVHNSAAIYFDYNLPIITNDSWITISDTVLTGPSIEVNEITNSIKEEFSQKLTLVPNPFTSSLMLVLPQDLVGVSVVHIYDLLGKKVYSTSTNGNSNVMIDGSEFKSGVYLVELSNSSHVIGRSKVVKY